MSIEGKARYDQAPGSIAEVVAAAIVAAVIFTGFQVGIDNVALDDALPIAETEELMHGVVTALQFVYEHLFLDPPIS